MGMGLGLGAIAGNAFFDKTRQLEQYDHDKAIRDAELTNLPDKTAAERSGYQLNNARSQSSMQMLPAETANRQTRLGLEAGDLSGQKDRQPDELATKASQARVGLSNATNTETNLPKTQEVANNTLQGQVLQSRADLEMLPQKIVQAKVQGTLSDQGQQDVVLGTLGQLISGQDKEGALHFANQIAKNTNLMPNTNGKTFTDIKPITGGPEGDGYEFHTADGESRFVPVAHFKSAMAKMKSGDYQFIHDTNGNVWSGNKNTGTVTQTHKGDAKLAKGQHTPAEVQTMEWLMNKGVAKNAGHAWDMVRSSREKTRTSFITDYVAKNGLPGQDTSALAAQAGKVYDDLKRTLGPEPATRGASPTSSSPPPAGSPDWTEWTQQ